ncbi:hypothetical protein P4S72_23265 [Vibrio sp. PP-XX7]
MKTYLFIFVQFYLFTVHLHDPGIRSCGNPHGLDGNVNDSVPLSAMTIPGTYDSGAMYEPVSGTAKTQNLSIQAQLNIGVRYLDIRLRHYNDALIVHHGSILPAPQLGGCADSRVTGF